MELTRAALPWPAPFEELKRCKLAAHGAAEEPYDLLFVGSSIVHRGIDPAVVDRRLAQRGVRARSFNLGVPGMLAHETDELLRRMAQGSAPPARWVVIEVHDWDPRSTDFALLKDVAWHTPLQTWRALRATAGERSDAARKIERLGGHLRAFALRWSSGGHGPASFAALRSRAAPLRAEDLEWLELDRDELPRSWNGFLPLRLELPLEPGSRRERRRHALTKDLPGYEARLRELRASPRPVHTPVAERAGLEQVRFLRGAGSEPIYIAGPTLGRAPGPPPALRELEQPVAWIAFDDPDAFPELYAPAHRFDPSHLDAVGAALWSERVADALAEVLRGAER